MSAHNKIYTAPPGTGRAVLGKTLPDLLYDACERYDNPAALNQPDGAGWTPVSLEAFRRQAEETALGLRALGLHRGDHAALLMESDVSFCVADMGCLLAGVADVPIYLTHTAESVRFVLEHAEAKALFISDFEHLNTLAPALGPLSLLKVVIVAEGKEGAPPAGLPEAVLVLSLEEVQARGRERREREPGAVEAMRAEIRPDDVATIIYTSGTTGQPKGVMLTHENISYDALTSFSGLTGFRPGPGGEIGLSFLPLTHIFARTLQYGYVAHGASLYFTTPEDLSVAFQKVRPTLFATVPRVLEKVYARIQERTEAAPGVKKRLGRWALGLARRYELGKEPAGRYRLQLALADVLVFKKWRAAVGGRVRFVIAGGAALNAEIANVLGAGGIPVLQGYGLTETSPVITYNRPGRNRAGTVGEPLPGVEVTIADDGEILTRGPHVMRGYYKDEEKTREVIDRDGWFHTGDIGEFTPEGFLRITDRKKDLFKLSTGKYVTPQVLENRLGVEAVIEQAVVVGEGQKFCGALLFPDEAALRTFARRKGLGSKVPVEELVRRPEVVAYVQRLVDRANEGLDPWCTIKRFTLVPQHLSVQNGLLTPTLKVKRSLLNKRFEHEIAALYDETSSETGSEAGGLDPDHAPALRHDA